MKKTVSQRQIDLLKYIEECMCEQQRIPSYREMAKAMNVSAVGTIQDHLKKLMEAGYLVKDGKNIQLAPKKQTPILSIPIVGEVAAGPLTEAIEDSGASLPVSKDMLKHSNNVDDYFALRVKGNSMIEAGICEGDMVVIYQKARVKSGDFIVARLHGDATLKEIRFPKKNSKKVELIPWNKELDVIKVEANEDFEVLGKVVALQRFL